MIALRRPSRIVKRRKTRMTHKVISDFCSPLGAKRLVAAIKASSTPFERLEAISKAVDHLLPRYDETLIDLCIHEGLVNHLCLKIGHVMEVLRLPLVQARATHNIQIGAGSDASTELSDAACDRQFVLKSCTAILILYRSCSMHTRYWSYREIGREAVLQLVNVAESHTPHFCVCHTEIESRDTSTIESENERQGQIDDKSSTNVLTTCVKTLEIMTESPLICETFLQVPSTKSLTSNGTMPFDTLFRILLVRLSCPNNCCIRNISEESLIHCIKTIVKIARAGGQNGRIRDALRPKVPAVLDALKQMKAQNTFDENIQTEIRKAIKEIDWFSAGTKLSLAEEEHGDSSVPIEEIDAVQHIILLITKDSPHLSSSMYASKPLDKHEQLLFLLSSMFNCETDSLIIRTSAAKGIQILCKDIDPSELFERDASILEKLVIASHLERDKRIERRLVDATSTLIGGIQDVGEIHSSAMRQLQILLEQRQDRKMIEHVFYAIYRQSCSNPRELGTKLSLLESFSKTILEKDLTRQSMQYAANSVLNLAQESVNGENLTRSKYMLESILHMLRQSLEQLHEEHMSDVRDALFESIIVLSQNIPLRRRLAKQQGLMSTLIRFSRTAPNEDIALKEQVKQALVVLSRAM